MYLLIDNYDSFTYNVYQYLREITTEEITVVRNDAVTLDEISAMKPAGIIISPGPGRPENAGISVDVIKKFAGSIPILGICLGHQAIGYAFGGKIIGSCHISHGKTSPITHDGQGLFRSIPSPAVFTRYHSLVVEKKSLPECLQITATSPDGEIMGVRHAELQIEGVQFHPESMASEYGMRLLKNFLGYKREAFDMKGKLQKIIGGENMTADEASDFMEELTEGNLTSAQIAGYLTALNAKGISPGEIAGCARVLRSKVVHIPVENPLLDTCGTGGDGLSTFNISSLSALAASACGARVAKHGNRAVSSVSGSADFYQALGLRTDLTPDRTAELFGKTGFGFLFAPLYHAAMRFAAQPRRELGVKSIMNLLGPLSNPASADYQLLGLFDEKYCTPVAEAAKILGVKRVMTVHSHDGLDEISPCAPTRIVFADENGKMTDSLFDPADLDIPAYTTADLQGGTPEENAEMALELMQGRGPQAVFHATLLNTGAALFVYGSAGSIEEGYHRVRKEMESGKVYEHYLTIKESLNELFSAEDA